MSNFRSYLESLSLTKKGIDLNEVQKEQFSAFLNQIKGASIIYRGVNGDYLRRRYNEDASNVSLLSDLLFLYGDKGKAFCKKMMVDNDINNIERICFKSILHEIKETFNNKSSNSPSVNRHLCKFMKENKTPISSLISIKNNEWCEKIESLPEEVRIAVKDYYISFLHTIEKAGYGNYSYFLSTTNSYDTANYFRGHDIEHGIIMVGWTNNKKIKGKDRPELKKILDKYEFPTFNSVVYSDQHEVTCKCGLLPHFIIGYFYKKKFEINPYILEVEDMSSVRKEGLPVNQESFLKLLSKTNFKSYYETCDCFYSQQGFHRMP